MALMDTEPMSRLLKLAKKFNCFYLSGLHASDCRAFVVDGQQVGLVRPNVMKELLSFPQVFQVQPEYVQLNPAFRDYAERSAKMEEVLKEWRDGGKFVTLRGWREECYEVRAHFNTQPLLKMDRSATCLFGIRNYGVDITGYVMDREKGLSIWLQKRSPTKQTWPGYWDNMVGGGLSVGYGIHETGIKEAGEEASIPTKHLGKLKSAGCVSFFFESERGLFPNTEFVYDLELPPDFVPCNGDGEVETFELLPVKECLERVLSPEFKTTSVPVVLDFLIRHGYITAENEPNFIKIVELLHVPLQTIYSQPQRKYKIEANGEANNSL
ncbi:uncharacterized protein [Neodiprion pinetum]|uniref:Uncharacterized protein YJR142W n=1 Tax=Neodiprion lecontei TaxID=441921 RepID=A0A6J0BC55_NEOLC|nr:uncharacterized protein YJR142W [Neodiprion lecontei]XP_046421542.1 uncharacterized protein YJR142W [Neodiprion fabricii]XP_046479387.1 uncharacterized protein YJR142W [Neodiprion pinetum]XP_046616520.1 uncharacterized protein YJR142W [Neodiprion virginianus]